MIKITRTIDRERAITETFDMAVGTQKHVVLGPYYVEEDILHVEDCKTDTVLYDIENMKSRLSTLKIDPSFLKIIIEKIGKGIPRMIVEYNKKIIFSSLEKAIEYILDSPNETP